MTTILHKSINCYQVLTSGNTGHSKALISKSNMLGDNLDNILKDVLFIRFHCTLLGLYKRLTFFLHPFTFTF